MIEAWERVAERVENEPDIPVEGDSDCSDSGEGESAAADDNDGKTETNVNAGNMAGGFFDSNALGKKTAGDGGEKGDGKGDTEEAAGTGNGGEEGSHSQEVGRAKGRKRKDSDRGNSGGNNGENNRNNDGDNGNKDNFSSMRGKPFRPEDDDDDSDRESDARDPSMVVLKVKGNDSDSSENGSKASSKGSSQNRQNEANSRTPKQAKTDLKTDPKTILQNYGENPSEISPTKAIYADIITSDEKNYLPPSKEKQKVSYTGGKKKPKNAGGNGGNNGDNGVNTNGVNGGVNGINNATADKKDVCKKRSGDSNGNSSKSAGNGETCQDIKDNAAGAGSPRKKAGCCWGPK
jgi:hypothetical protein